MEIHYTPKHGSWLNIAEMELSVLSEQCLDRRLPDQATLAREVGAWEQERNARSSMIDWRIMTENPRIKLKHLYPSFDDGRVTRPVPPFSGFSLHHEALLLIYLRLMSKRLIR